MNKGRSFRKRLLAVPPWTLPIILFSFILCKVFGYDHIVFGDILSCWHHHVSRRAQLDGFKFQRLEPRMSGFFCILVAIFSDIANLTIIFLQNYAFVLNGPKFSMRKIGVVLDFLSQLLLICEYGEQKQACWGVWSALYMDRASKMSWMREVSSSWG